MPHPRIPPGAEAQHPHYRGAWGRKTRLCATIRALERSILLQDTLAADALFTLARALVEGE